MAYGMEWNRMGWITRGFSVDSLRIMIEMGIG
jgi:hypothetical protein